MRPPGRSLGLVPGARDWCCLPAACVNVRMPSAPALPDLVRRVVLLGLGITVAAQLFSLYAPEAPGGLDVPHSDKLVHALIFAAPVFLALLLGLPPRPVVLVSALHAPVSELIQHFWLPNRTGDSLDVTADLVGVVLGLIAARMVLGLLTARRSRQ